jgi:23S rRNA (cytidine1920-2'-O)/16S rRNA (cytidine1409-2'-O)-methyltransferase
MRVDLYLVAHGYFESRNKAQEAIKTNQVLVNHVAVKPSYEVLETDELTVLTTTHDVARSAQKLREALAAFGLHLNGKTILDLGQGTGGFTQVCLDNEAAAVIGVDVGHSQLHDSLRKDPRVVVYEGVNIKQLSSLSLPPIDVVVCDLSFISSLSVLAHITLVGDEFLLLLKPQFETHGKHLKFGVVHQRGVHHEVTKQAEKAITDLGFCVQGIHPCQTKGKTGNQEYMVWFNRC